ncbi:MAG: tubulin-like doman-containing protein [Acidobacteriota bacterium]
MTRDRKLIVDEMLTTPSGVSPMLFVGLGGAGCRMVKRVADHLRRRPDFRERFSDLVKFAMVDTNVNDLESYRDVADATFLISDFEKEEYANLASGKKFLEADEYFTQWVPSDYRFRSGDTAGAGQIRIEARLGVYYQMKHKDFAPRFRNLLEQLKSHEHGHRRLDSDEIRIVLCYSIAGGTGSGCHLPVSYMLREQASELGRATMIGVAVLPAVFEDKVGVNKDGTFANGYAALKETEHLMKLGAPDSPFFPADGEAFHYNPANPSKVRVYERPFDFLYLIDKPESFSVPEPVDAAADGLYLQFFSPLYGAQLSDYDNYTQYQRFLVPDDFEERGIAGFSTFYGSFGCAVLLVPVPGLIEYCSQAAALSLIRASFMGEIPPDATYSPLRQDRARFDEVTKNDDEDAQIYRASEIPDQPQKTDRNRLYDRLFSKHVRLLAACEYRENKAGRFQGIFRHGHYLGSEPKLDGTVSFDPEIHGDAMRQEQQLVEGRLSASIGGIVLPLLAGMPGDDPTLLDRAHQAIKGHNPAPVRTPIKVVELKRRATSWRDELRREGLRRLRDGFSEGTVRMPGMERLVNLEFLRSDAAEVDLIAKRYAVLSLLERVNFDQAPDDERVSNFDVQEKKPSAKIKPDDELIEHVLSQARDLAFHDVRREFLSQLGELREALQGYADEMREMERGSINLEREYSRLLERLQTQGEDSANQYVLDAEALQGEDNRRFWDFYFEDKIADLPELSLTNDRVQQILSDTVVDLSQRRGRSTSTTRLEQLFTALRHYAHEVLVKRIGGDPHSPDRELRDGLTLSDALELEIIYRALYRSHSETIKGEGERRIRQVLAEYRALPEEKQIDFGDLKHQEYLRDKIKRVVKEKASILCVYDQGQDQHGGVRPDHVFLAAIDENFKNSNIERALRNANIADLDWVSSDWHNAKEIVFYRSVLNVPLYAFGRLDVMKHHYDTFRRQARRSKALHIDKNWEGTALSDLDPNVLKEQHRQVLVRDQIINFTALLCTEHPRLKEGANCLIRRRGRYLLLDPDLESLPEDHQAGYHELGDTLARAIEKLPKVLNAERVNFSEYRDSLHGIRNGMAPELLGAISHLPFEWRLEYEDLSNHYGHDRKPAQRLILNDLQDSYERLHEALEKLLEELRNRQLESRSRNEDFRIYAQNLTTAEAQKSLAQSIQILAFFSERWSKLEDSGAVPETPSSFQSLFKPLTAGRLQSMLEGLRHNHRNGEDPQKGGTVPKGKGRNSKGAETETPAS